MNYFSQFTLSFLFSIGFFTATFSQEKHLEVIGSAGTYFNSSFGSISWTIGEVCVETYGNSSQFLTQGFHQSEQNITLAVKDFFIPEGFSPNDDGINDLFVIRGIEKYPNNFIEIFNRWGNKIYESHHYANKWDGKTNMINTVGEDELPSTTYFYLFDFGDGSDIRKGSIYLNK